MNFTCEYRLDPLSPTGPFNDDCMFAKILDKNKIKIGFRQIKKPAGI